METQKIKWLNQRNWSWLGMDQNPASKKWMKVPAPTIYLNEGELSLGGDPKSNGWSSVSTGYTWAPCHVRKTPNGSIAVGSVFHEYTICYTSNNRLDNKFTVIIIIHTYIPWISPTNCFLDVYPVDYPYGNLLAEAAESAVHFRVTCPEANPHGWQ